MSAQPVAFAGVPDIEAIDESSRAALFSAGRSANTFTSEPVTDEELTAIWQDAKWGPTAANFQPLRVLYVRPGAGRERLVKLMNDGNKDKTLTAPAVAVLAYDTLFHEHIPTVLPFRPELKDVFDAQPDFRLESSKFNASLQAAYFILAVRAHGLAAGPMGGFDKDGVDAEFFPDGRWKSLLVVNIGHPGEGAWFDRLPRLEDEHVIAWA